MTEDTSEFMLCTPAWFEIVSRVLLTFHHTFFLHLRLTTLGILTNAKMKDIPCPCNHALKLSIPFTIYSFILTSKHGIEGLST